MKYKMNRKGKIWNMFQLWEKILLVTIFMPNIFRISLKIIPAILLIGIFTKSVQSQNWEGMRKTGLWERWAITANLGYTSYYGDLSLHDKEIAGKITHESGPAYGATVSKYLNNIIGLSGQVLVGNLKGSKQDISFKTNLIEYNLQLRVNFVNLINNKKNHKIGILGFAGVGQFLFTTTVDKEMEGKVSSSSSSTRVPELVVFAGGGVHYIIGSNYSISAGLSLRKSQNDKMDGVKKNKDYDYYTFLNIGITYYIPTLIKGPLRNKARIACSNFKFASNHRR